MKSDEFLKCVKNIGINSLKGKYVLMERPIQQKFKNLKINGLGFDIQQYEIIGVGNLSMMSCNSPFFQMLTYIITPYYKDIPLFSSDFILKGDKHDVINEIYSTVYNKDDEIYKEYIEKIKDNMNSCKLTDNENKSSWYDEWRPTFVNKTGSEADDEIIVNLFKRNIELLIELEQKSKFIDNVDTRVEKHKVITQYVNNLVEKGGISTDMFKAVIGADETKKLFNTILFGNDCFKPFY
ncbi:hypothetical protein PIROE2DRAFT_4216 [Piromyces sp. E2]|nr:hypothetical protein PIROE2DRAFT_4216 [Piromyces sp. E2]|eukprot:OUM68206.1 hypothetical protein PIROE2DRAFT_4216 [Piromyces sp. E2]